MKTTMRQCILISILCLSVALPVWSQQEVPEAAKERFKTGIALIEKAEKPADFLAAMTEFEAAAVLAPKWPDIHFNLAQLAAETDKPAKAIKEYSVYLALTPGATDRVKVEEEMARMKELMAIKRKVGLPGVKFVSMADGIAVLEVYPGTRVAKSSLERGDKIIGVDKQSVVGMKLVDFFRTIETSTQTAAQRSTTARLYGRFSKDRTGGDMVMLFVKSPGVNPQRMVPCKKDIFRSQIVEIEEDEFEAEVLKESLPVVMTLWNSDCKPCSEFIPIVEAESVKYAGKVKFVNVNVDENKNLIKQLAVKGVPTLIVFKGGSAISTNTGRLDKDKVEEILQNAAAR